MQRNAFVYLSLVLSLAGIPAAWSESENDAQGGLTDEQIADIDHQLEQLQLTRAYAIAPEENSRIDRKPGIIEEPVVDTGVLDALDGE